MRGIDADQLGFTRRRFGFDVPAHVPGGQAERAQAPDREVGEVLAHAASFREHRVERRADLGERRVERERLEDLRTERNRRFDDRSTRPEGARRQFEQREPVGVDGHETRRRSERDDVECHRAPQTRHGRRHPLPRHLHPREFLGPDDRLGDRHHGEAVVGPVQTELDHPVAEDVGAFVVLVGFRISRHDRGDHVLRRCRPGEHAGDAVSVEHRRAVEVAGEMDDPVPLACHVSRAPSSAGRPGPPDTNRRRRGRGDHNRRRPPRAW